MSYVCMGTLAFFFFILYDVNSIIIKNKLLNISFFAGIILLITATAGIIISSWDRVTMDTLRITLYGIIALVFLLLLIYTLFFALPFKNTYIKSDSAPQIYKNGVYALCRHPGVLWFTGFYISLGLALNIPYLLGTAILFSLLNVIYVIFQDRWTFIRTFHNYRQYKDETPFLFPNKQSIKRCIETL